VLTIGSSDVATLRRPTAVRGAWLLGGLAVLAVLVLASIAFGTRVLSLDELLAALNGEASPIVQGAITARIPRTVLAVLVGAALAIAGTAFQGVTRNPLADPGILGVSAGAALAVVMGIAFFAMSSPYMYIAVAVAGAAAAAVFVYVVGSLGRGGATPLKLALAGAAATAAFLSLINAILLPRVDILQTVRMWQVGGVGGATWDRIAIVTPVLVIGALVCFAMGRGMNSLALGDELATGLGEHVGRTRLVSAIGAVMLVGTAVAIAWPIAFVGLVVRDVCRLLVGADYRWILPFAAVLGAALLVGSDIVGRVIARPEEIEVGIITALIGAPFFIWIVRRQKVREL